MCRMQVKKQKNNEIKEAIAFAIASFLGCMKNVCSAHFATSFLGWTQNVQIGQMEPVGVTRRRTWVRREVTFVQNTRQ